MRTRIRPFSCLVLAVFAAASAFPLAPLREARRCATGGATISVGGDMSRLAVLPSETEDKPTGRERFDFTPIFVSRCGNGPDAHGTLSLRTAPRSRPFAGPHRIQLCRWLI